MSRALTTELMLAAACCRWPPSPAGDQKIRALAERVSDWNTFDSVVQRNRISPLVHRAVRRTDIDLPEPLRAELARRAAAAGRRSLVLARESLRLQQAFEAARLPAMIFKGIPVAILAYGELGLKESIDIDLLVRPEAAVEARRLLVGLGYSISMDELDSDEFERFVRHANESGFLHVQTGLEVDLHWRLVPNRGLLGNVTAHGPAQPVTLPGGTLRTLADDALLAYLSVHGALHNWCRLKWLADLGALLSRHDEQEISRLYHAAMTYDAGRCMAVALLLCRSLFDLRLEVPLLRSLEQDARARALADNALATLDYRKGTDDPGPYSEPWLREKAAQFFLAPGVAHSADQLRMLWICPKDRAHISLPRSLGFVYHLIRVPLWLGRFGMRLIGRPVT